MFNLHVTITTRFQENDPHLKRGLVCVGFRVVDLCDVYSFTAIYKVYVLLIDGCNDVRVRVPPPGDNISVITRSSSTYAFLCDTSIIVNTRGGPCQHGFMSGSKQ